MNSKTNIVRAILLDASECDRPEADHPATIEICADDLQRILERHITEPTQCLLQIAEPQKFTVDSEMSRAFEIEYGQDWKDPDWRRETGVWASAWHKATNAARAAAPQAVQPAVADGWTLVPMEGTEEMARAFRAESTPALLYMTTIQCAHFQERYRAMIAAAPAHPAEAVQPAVPKWIDDPHDIEQGQMLNPEWVKLQQSDAPSHPAEGVPAQQRTPLRDLALGVTSFLDHAGFDTSHLPSGMGAALRRLRDAAIATQPAAQGRDLLVVIKAAAAKMDAAKRCHPNAVETLVDEALELLDGDREPAAQGLDEKRLDFIENNSVSLEPEWEGPWTAMVYRESESPKVIVDGKTARDAIDAAMAALAAQAKQGGTDNG